MYDGKPMSPKRYGTVQTGQNKEETKSIQKPFKTMNNHQGIKRRNPSPPLFPSRIRSQNHNQPTTTRRQIQVTLLHSTNYTSIVYQAMKDIHQDRDLLLSSLLYYSGFIKQTPSFFHVVKPKLASRYHLESFHDGDYLDLLECSGNDNNDDCDNGRNSQIDCNNCNKENVVSEGGNGDNTIYADNNDIYTPDSHKKEDRKEVIENNGDNTPFRTNEKDTNINEHKYEVADSERNKNIQKDFHKILETYGLVDDCPLPTSLTSRMNLWNYCLSVAGASLHGARLLLEDKTDVAINFAGGRHHAHKNQAGGFCFVNDVILAIQTLIRPRHSSRHSSDVSLVSTGFRNRKKRVLYLDLDIHHCDGVQTAFYDTDQVLTISLHRYTSGFFPSTSGSIHEKGKYKTNGVGYNLNLPMPRSCTNIDFVDMCKRILTQILPEYDPDCVVVCVGADGLQGDDLVKETNEGWSLTPEGLAECVRLIALECSGKGGDEVDVMDAGDNSHSTNATSSVGGGGDIHQLNTTRQKKKRKLLILGGGGYNPSNTARTFLLCTAAACEGARPGMIKELPKDIPQHEYFIRYGPSFELYTQSNFDDMCLNNIDIYKHTNKDKDDDYSSTLKQSIESIYLTQAVLKNRNKREKNYGNFIAFDDVEVWDYSSNHEVGKKVTSRRRRKKSKRS